MSDVKTTLIWTLRDEVSASAKKINTSLDTMGVKAKGAKGILGELGNVTGGLLTPQTLAAGGALALAGAIWGAAEAAIGEETSIAKLNTSLAANAVGWDGNTQAVDDYIVKTEWASAFTKGDLRNSLALLVGATHDVTKAQKLQNDAMDLARFLGEDLGTATDTITKIEAGRLRGLAALGIGITSNMTKEQALAAVEKVTAGQEQAYANSHAAALDRIRNAWNDFVANVGEDVLTVADDFGKLVPAQTVDQKFRDVEAGFQDVSSSADAMTMSAKRDFEHNLDPAISHTTDLIDDMARALAPATLSIQDTTNLFLASRTKPKTPAIPRSGPVKPRASGGPVVPGGEYMVGEHGPERLSMYAGGGGTVTPMGGGGSTLVAIPISEAALVAAVDRGMYFKLARASASATRK